MAERGTGIEIPAKGLRATKSASADWAMPLRSMWFSLALRFRRSDNDQHVIQTTVSAIWSSEVGHQQIPFGHTAYGSALVLAAYSLSLETLVPHTTIIEIISELTRIMLGGRLFGVGFIAQVLKLYQNTELCRSFSQTIQQTLDEPGIDYEDRIYLLHGLWLLDSQARSLQEILPLITESPIWPYIMHGTEEIVPASDGLTTVLPSHLYRAILLDLILRIQEAATQDFYRAFDERYRGSTLVTWAAFAFSVLVFAGLWFALGWPLLRLRESAYHFWFLREYSSLTRMGALAYLGGIVAISLLPSITFNTLRTLWSLLIRSRIQSDQHIIETILQNNKGALRFLLGDVIVALVINLGSGSIGEAFTYIAPGKK